MSTVTLVRRLIPVACAVVVLIALWPAVCMSGEDEPTSCRSVVIPLPWGESADSWGMVVPIVAALLTYVLLRQLLRRRPARPA